MNPLLPDPIKITVLAGLLFGTTITQTYAQNLDTAKLNQYFATLETNNKFMGSVAIAKDGKILYTRSVGYSDVDQKVPLQQRPHLHIGSISKMFTATMIMQAMEEKKLSLDTKLSAYFPKVKNADQISIDQLLRHQSGIHNFTSDDDYQKWYTQPQTPVAMLQRIEALDSDFAPGETTKYSNTNYVLLSLILEKIYKKPYADLLKQKVATPLGLKDTYYGGKIDTKKGEAYSYNYTNRWVKEAETDPSVPLGAGGVVSTPADLIRFEEGIFSTKLVKPETLEQMKTKKDVFGIGMFAFPFNEKQGYGHDGAIDGFSSMVGYFPDDKVSFSFISNGSNYVNNNITIVLCQAAFQQPFEIPVFTTYAVTEAELAQYEGVYAVEGAPMKITFKKDKDVLTAQATGQPAMPLTATAKHQFSFEQAAAVFEFDPAAKTMTLKQGGGSFTFTKE
jgi:CubicO group peptidase (beta-lactamase class C family)